MPEDVQDINPKADDIGQDGAAFEEQTPPASGAAPSDPWSEKAPEFLSEKYGVGTYQELQSKISEYERNAQLAEVYRGLYQDAAGGGASHAQAAEPARPAGAAGEFFGFKSMDEYIAAYRADPMGTERKKLSWMMQGAGAELLKPVLEQHLGPMRGELFASRARSAAADVAQRYPEAGKAETFAGAEWEKFNAQHGDWLRQLGEARPDVNVHELGFKAFHFDRVYKELQALKAKQGELRSAAGTSRASVAGAPVPAGRPKTHAEAVQLAAAKMRAQGVAGVDEWVSAQMSALQR